MQVDPAAVAKLLGHIAPHKQAAVAARLQWLARARPKQVPPPGDWFVFLAMAGRGWGKTACGAQEAWWHAAWHDGARVAVVAPTAGDLRRTCFEGESGILRCAPPEVFENGDPDGAYNRSLFELRFKNGSVIQGYSAAEPARLRGPNHGFAWIDELAAWERPEEAFDMLMMTLRIGARPQVIATTTPRPVPLVRKLLARAGQDVLVVRGSTFENEHLAPAFVAQLRARYEGSRLGRQELLAEMLEDVPGSLWPRALIEACRMPEPPEPPGPLELPPALSRGHHKDIAAKLGLIRIVVAVDPSGAKEADEENADEIGIVAAGVTASGITGAPDRAYVLEDASGSYSPEGWGAKVVEVFDRWGADKIVAEQNYGGGMVQSTIRAVRRTAPVKLVTASRGKAVRAEPVAALYEQGRVLHTASFAKLEDQLCVAAGTLIETDRGQVPVEDVTTQDRVFTRNGFAPIVRAWQTGIATRLIRLETERSTLLVTGEHPISLFGPDEFVPAQSVRLSDRLVESPRWASTGHPSRGVAAGIIGCRGGISATPKESSSTSPFMKPTSALSRQGEKFTTGMRTRDTTSRETSLPSRGASTSPSTDLAGSCSGNSSSSGRASSAAAKPAAKPVTHGRSVPIVAICEHTDVSVPVYNLSVANGFLPEYFANGVLTHNCSFTRTGYHGPGSPDRADALVWAITDLLLDETGGYDISAMV